MPKYRIFIAVRFFETHCVCCWVWVWEGSPCPATGIRSITAEKMKPVLRMVHH